MKYHSGFTIGIHAFLVLLISILAVYIFSTSFVYTMLDEFISGLFAFDSFYISLILAVILMGTGSVSVLLSKKTNFGFFMVLVSILFIPSVLETTDIDWGGMIGVDLQPGTGVPASLLFLFLSLVVFSHILLRMTMYIDNAAELDNARGFTREEIENVFSKQVLWSLGFIVVTIIIIGVIFFAVESVGTMLQQSVNTMKLDILFAGIGCVIVLVVVVYFAVISGRMPEKQIAAEKNEDGEASCEPDE